jgi:replicative DNA helicase
VIVIDYLQKVSIEPQQVADEGEKVTIIVEGLKDMAMSLNIPVIALVAADREGLKSKRLHLHHLRGSSALDYECDVALILNNKWEIVAKTHIAYNPYRAQTFREWVVFTVEKNRGGPAMIPVEFRLLGQHFAFDPAGARVKEKLVDERISDE